MILSGDAILQAINKNQIIITPFDEKKINPNSYDVSIGDEIFFYSDDVVCDTDAENYIQCANIPEQGYLLRGNKFYYAFTRETIKTDSYVPILHNKSGTARKGLFSHISADLQQIHSDNKILLQLYPVSDTLVYPGQRIAQISFWHILEE